MTRPTSPETPEPDPRASRPVSVVPAALFLVSVFYVTEPMEIGFSAGPSMHIIDSEESTLERVDRNVEAHRSGHAGRKVGMIVLAGAGLYWLRSSRNTPCAPRGPIGYLVLAFAAWCLLSVTWSIQPAITLKRLFVLGSLFLGALGIARRFTLSELCRVCVLATGIVAAVGLSSELAFRTLRPWESEYRYSGLNWPAFTCWNLTLFLLSLWIVAGRRIGTWWIPGALTIALAFLTRTRAGTASLIAAGAGQFALTVPVPNQVGATVLAALVVGLGLLGAAFLGVDLPLMLVHTVNLGREESAGDISGRAGVWTGLLPYILARPVTGYGYESFWSETHLRAIGEQNWGVPDAHNGYINLALGVGMVGSAVYSLILFASVVTAFRRRHSGREREYIFAIGVLVTTMFNSLFVAVQLGPYLISFLCMAVIARLGFFPAVSPPDVRDAISRPIPADRNSRPSPLSVARGIAT